MIDLPELMQQLATLETRLHQMTQRAEKLEGALRSVHGSIHVGHGMTSLVTGHKAPGSHPYAEKCREGRCRDINDALAPAKAAEPLAPQPDGEKTGLMDQMMADPGNWSAFIDEWTKDQEVLNAERIAQAVAEERERWVQHGMKASSPLVDRIRAEERARVFRECAGIVRTTPHSCQSDTHCCALHQAHESAAQEMEKRAHSEVPR